MGMKSSLISLPLSKFNQNWLISSEVIKVGGGDQSTLFP